uniref:Uncharacterized protein n=1 Tax=Anopheles farauti TaxID=69004 RepID=A0A182QPK4_9DIPT
MLSFTWSARVRRFWNEGRAASSDFCMKYGSGFFFLSGLRLADELDMMAGCLESPAGGPRLPDRSSDFFKSTGTERLEIRRLSAGQPDCITRLSDVRGVRTKKTLSPVYGYHDHMFAFAMTDLCIRRVAEFVRLVRDPAPDTVPTDRIVAALFVALPIALLVVPVVAGGVVEPIQQPVQDVLDHVGRVLLDQLHRIVLLALGGGFPILTGSVWSGLRLR